MIKSIVSSVARLSLVPAKMTIGVAGSLLNELRGNGTVDVPAAPPAPRPKKAQSRRPKRAPRRKPPGDAAIARKVESAIFRDSDVDKGKVVVNVAAGVAQLRGEAGPRQVPGAEVGIAHGSGGVLSAISTVILGTEATL